MTMRSLLNSGAYAALRATGLPRFRRRAASGAVVLCFHNVVADELVGRAGDPVLQVGVTAFAEYIGWLKRHYSIVAIGELLGRLRRSQPAGGLAALTFDDGYAGVMLHAVPVMRAAGVPFAVFPVVRGADSREAFWWDRYELTEAQRHDLLTRLRGDQELITRELGGGTAVPDALLPASWDALRAIRGDDCTIGMHSVSHRNLAELTLDELAWELAESRRRLAEELGADAQILAFPYGWGGPLVIEAMRQAGIEAALTLNFGINSAGQPPHAIRRVAIPAGLRMANFACWAAGLRLSVQDLKSLLLGNF